MPRASGASAHGRPGTSGCQRAKTRGCECGCNGLLHQSDLLRAALTGSGSAGGYDKVLSDVYGSVFTSLKAPPGRTDVVRGNAWRTPPTDGMIERRIVDVTVRDVLARVHGLPAAAKTDWLSYYEDITLQGLGAWPVFATALTAIVGSATNPYSGYLWASMLAAVEAAGPPYTGAAVEAMITAARPTAASLVNRPATPTTAPPTPPLSLFACVQNPRARSGKSLQEIRELTFSAAITLCSNSVATPVTAQPPSDAQTVRQLVGAVTSADLWKHPVAVRYLLLPLVGHLRSVHGMTFSLDKTPEHPALLVEDLINEYLRDNWDVGGAW